MPIKSRENLVGAWAFLIGLILAIAAGIFSGLKSNSWVLGLLAILGVLVGYFVSEKESKTFLLAAVALVVVSFAGIQGLLIDAAVRGVTLGHVVSSTLGALLVMFVPAAIIVALKTVFAISTIRSN
jgi:uncharacterized membrane protein (UPF0136 family)